MAFGFYSPISVNSAQVPSTQTDFPMLVSVTDARFKTAANSGHVQNSSGFDIRPYTDSTLSTAISGYELERYNASTGEVVMWVKVSSLSSSTTPFVLAYGDSGISTDGSSSTTWSNGFISVYHLKDGTTLSLTDSLGTNNGTNHSCTAGAGQIDGGMALASASSQYVDIGTSITFSSSFTSSAWVKGTSFPNDYNGIVNQGVSSADRWGMFVKSTGKLYMVTNNGGHSYDGTGSHTLLTATWYYVVLVSDVPGNSLVGYVNAASDASTTTGGSTGGATTAIGRQQSTATRYFNGVMDEVRLASVARSANWITTEYNNQSAPATFSTLGTEATPSGAIRNSNWMLFFI